MGMGNCTPPAIEDFPPDMFTPQQRQAGAVIVHITISLYLFLALAVVCDKYFVPAVEKISQGISFSFSESTVPILGIKQIFDDFNFNF